MLSLVPNSGRGAGCGVALGQCQSQGELSHGVTWVQTADVTRGLLVHRARSCICLQEFLAAASPHSLWARHFCLRRVRYHHGPFWGHRAGQPSGEVCAFSKAVSAKAVLSTSGLPEGIPSRAARSRREGVGVVGWLRCGAGGGGRADLCPRPPVLRAEGSGQGRGTSLLPVPVPVPVPPRAAGTIAVALLPPRGQRGRDGAPPAPPHRGVPSPSPHRRTAPCRAGLRTGVGIPWAHVCQHTLRLRGRAPCLDHTRGHLRHLGHATGRAPHLGHISGHTTRHAPHLGHALGHTTRHAPRIRPCTPLPRVLNAGAHVQAKALPSPPSPAPRHSASTHSVKHPHYFLAFPSPCTLPPASHTSVPDSRLQCVQGSQLLQGGRSHQHLAASLGCSSSALAALQRAGVFNPLYSIFLAPI